MLAAGDRANACSCARFCKLFPYVEHIIFFSVKSQIVCQDPSMPSTMVLNWYKLEFLAVGIRYGSPTGMCKYTRPYSSIVGAIPRPIDKG